MKNSFVYKKYTFHRFNESTNEIEVDHEITAHRLMTPAERKQYKRLCIAGVVFGVLSLLFAVAGLTLIILTENVLSAWYCGVGLACILLCALPLRFSLQYAGDAHDMREYKLQETGFEDEDAAYQSMEDGVKDRAKVWREAHPLEEKIRIAKKTGNCVDIAELVRYCGADLADKLK